MEVSLITNLSKEVQEIAYIQSGVVISVLKYGNDEKMGQVFCEDDYFGLDSLIFGLNIIDYYKVGKTRFKKDSYSLFRDLLKDPNYMEQFFFNLKIIFMEIASFMKKPEEEILLLNLKKLHNRSQKIKGLPKEFVLTYISQDKIQKLLSSELITEDEELYYYNPK
ncbi:hypothetical protein XO10_08020 [Marinitoga sp. 1135]|uniref:Crp/Fnr family transcriptional regulator n=1 Tax=Marinitoga piezophila (strain DSM 14283 / JCM 11233 / KA3) TaxID=443254 RepID=H2J500_MARPK|nr:MULTISPECIES: hypothetical protein [Marinitoga]AEX86017.1 hypothetical protein Marpi_1628 [Marinitoga piezophila KA3]APT76442.1 hypothetical protein LN42_08680 [Marinitoga sp. 1137]NUU96204.1 hypothetical protein [Marinitoga sp. 1135]NUU98127.1 hypothetical protein [Marinitoga sp. 1138]